MAIESEKPLKPRTRTLGPQSRDVTPPSLTAHETGLDRELRGLWMLGEHELGAYIYEKNRRKN